MAAVVVLLAVDCLAAVVVVLLAAAAAVVGCCLATVPFEVVETFTGAVVWLTIVVVAFPVGVTLVLLLTVGNLAWLLGGDTFVGLTGRGVFPTGSVFFSIVVVVLFAGIVV